MNVENKTYQKPALKFVSLRNEEAVANTCWGGAGTTMTWYYNTSGTGYVSFQIASGSCTLSLINVTYYDGQGNQSTLSSSDALYDELYKALMSSGGESGNPFKGEGVNFPTTPDTSWS